MSASHVEYSAQGSASDIHLTFLNGKAEDSALILGDGTTWSYAELTQRVKAFSTKLGHTRSLLLIQAENAPEAITAYLAALCHGHVVMLIPPGHPGYLAQVKATFAPNWIFAEVNGEWRLSVHSSATMNLHPELAVLLPTSGSTGMVKFVRLSYAGLLANARSIIEYLRITTDDRALMTLPFRYSYGLSVLNSHLLAGATLLVTRRSLTEPALWHFFKEQGGTSISGVPQSYELLDSIGFEKLDLPKLRTLTQAGGRLPRDKVLRFARLAQQRGWRFYVMYGQTEASPRMAYVPPELLIDNPDCIGLAIPGGSLRLLDAQGREITREDVEGELVYEGPNVMLGYATSAQDLALGRKTQHLVTGDMGCLTRQGLFKITGRKSRFLKLFGLRIGLDELEQYLDQEGYRAVCGGSDSALIVLTLDRGKAGAISNVLSAKCELPASAIQVREVDAFPQLPSGKVDYPAITRMLVPPTARGSSVSAYRLDNVGRASSARSKTESVRSLYERLFPGSPVQGHDTFVSLGGDSLNFVEAVMVLENILGHLPEGWQNLEVDALEKILSPRVFLHQVDTASLFRCLAITAIVSNHFNLTKLPGGVYLLLVISGFNFARFQLARIVKTESVMPAISTLLRIAVPTVLALAVLQVKTGRFDVQQLALLGNWKAASQQEFGFWYLEVLPQILLIVAALLAVPAFRARAQADPFRFGFGMLLVLIAFMLLIPRIWSAEHLYNRVPHMLMWLFALGWMLQCAASRRQKIITVCIVFALSTVLLGWNPFAGQLIPSPVAWMWIGCMALLFVEKVQVPYPVNKVIYLVSGASMFIFIMHYTARNIWYRTGITQFPALGVLAGIVGGIAAWWLWERGTRFVLRNLVKRRSAPNE